VFAEDAQGTSVERRVLSLLLDVPGDGPKATFDQRQDGLRRMRGVIDQVVRAMAGTHAIVSVTPAAPVHAGYDASVFAQVRVSRDGDEQLVGAFGLASAKAMKAAGVDRPVVVAELDLAALIAMYPPSTALSPLPAFPSIERDVSLLVGEGVQWGQIDALVAEAGASSTDGLDLLAAWSFVGVFRGKPIEAGRKSVSLRLAFRDPARTLRHEEVEPAVDRIVALAKDRLQRGLLPGPVEGRSRAIDPRAAVAHLRAPGRGAALSRTKERAR
jgi:phenylalanyl-tRNA synthetase beta chain